MVTMSEELVKKMSTTSNELIDAEKRFDGYRSCKEVTVDDMRMMNDLMPRANALAQEFRDSVSEDVKKNSTEYGMLLARILCTDKAFKDLMNQRCPQKEFEALAERSKKEFGIQNE
jgi:hypothetical protein